MASPSKTDWAYVAGMIDADGSICISKTTAKARNGRPYWLFDCRTVVSNTSMDLMRWLKNKFGGYDKLTVNAISKKAKENGQKSIKPCYVWQMEGYKAQERFLLAILPYLVIKREQAILALEFVRMMGIKNPEKRAEIQEKMSKMNRTGIPNDYDAELPKNGMKIKSDLHGDMQCVPLATAPTQTT